MIGPSELLKTCRRVLFCSSLAFASYGWTAQPSPKAASPSPASQPLTVDGISFAATPGKLYVSLEQLLARLGSAKREGLKLPTAGELSERSDARLFDGEPLISMDALRNVGATVDWNEIQQTATIQLAGVDLTVHRGGKSVVVDKSSQSLYAYQGGSLILATHVSTGREGHTTPNGSFLAGPAKERMHRSKLYGFAPMPWSVQVHDNVFIHGFTSVPHRPASHGCIRVSLVHGNPARYFYDWVDLGTPVTIQGYWNSSHHSPHRRLRRWHNPNRSKWRTPRPRTRHRSWRRFNRRWSTKPDHPQPGPRLPKNAA